MRIRPGRPSDHPALAAIEVAAGQRFREVGLDSVADDAPPTSDELAEAAALLVAVDDEDRALGYAWVEIVDGHSHLEQLSVLPAHEGLGIGTSLLHAVEAFARGRGDDVVTLTTFRDVPFNAPFYARRGYEVLHEPAWGDELRELVADEARHGLDPSTRVVMIRDVTDPGPDHRGDQ